MTMMQHLAECLSCGTVADVADVGYHCRCGNWAWQSIEAPYAGPGILTNGARVRQYRDIPSRPGSGGHRIGVALCEWRTGFVTWIVVRRSHGWDAYHGEYVDTYDAGMTSWRRRVDEQVGRFR